MHSTPSYLRAKLRSFLSDSVLVSTVVISCMASVLAVFFLWPQSTHWLGNLAIGIFFGLCASVVVATNHYLLASFVDCEDTEGAVGTAEGTS